MSPTKPNIKLPEGYELLWNDDKQTWVMHFKGYTPKVSSIKKSTLEQDVKTSSEKGKNSNRTMLAARQKAYSNYYTRINDVAQAVHPHREEFKGRTVYCPCDKTYNSMSNFLKYFNLYFKELKINKVICTQYIQGGRGIKWELTKEFVNKFGVVDESEIPSEELYGDGSFDSEECKRIMLGENGDGSDVIVCANPPFHRWKEFISQIIDCNCHFLVLSFYGSITYKETFRYIMDNKMWLSYPISGGEMLFHVTDEYKNELKEQKEGTAWRNVNGEIMARRANVRWVTNFPVKKRMENLYLSNTYKGNEDKYPNIINLENCIDIGHWAKNGNWEGQLNMIPRDYPYIMAVPITFLEVYNPDQFEIVGCPDAQVYPEGWGEVPQWFIDSYSRNIPKGIRSTCFVKDKKEVITFKRLLIKLKK